jgi:hypothetical protein
MIGMLLRTSTVKPLAMSLQAGSAVKIPGNNSMVNNNLINLSISKAVMADR